MLNKKATNYKLHKMTMVSMLSAISSVLMFLSFSVPFLPPFLKLDFSELPALIASFTFGPLSGVAVVLVKNLINLLFTTTGGIGEFANFIIGSSFVLSAGLIYKHKKTKKLALISLFSATVIMAFFAAAANYFVLFPVYSYVIPMDSLINMFTQINSHLNSLLSIITIVIIPFNLVKGTMISIITFFIYKKLSAILKN